MYDFLFNFYRSDFCEVFKLNSIPSIMDDSKPPENLKKPPSWPHNDWIGPVDKRSNLRKIQFAEPLEETEKEAVYRKMRQETYEWNHQFWAQQNKKFIQVQNFTMFTEN